MKVSIENKCMQGQHEPCADLEQGAIDGDRDSHCSGFRLAI